MPPVVPERSPTGEVIEDDERLDKASEHKIIFTDTSQHKENRVKILLYLAYGSCDSKYTWRMDHVTPNITGLWIM